VREGNHDVEENDTQIESNASRVGSESYQAKAGVEPSAQCKWFIVPYYQISKRVRVKRKG
jgi:hypothetical protein